MQATRSTTARGSKPDTQDCDKGKESVSCCHLDGPYAELTKRVEELEVSIGTLTAEVSESLKSIGSAPDKAKGTPGSGIAKTVVEIQESVGNINKNMEDVNQERTETRIQKLNHTDILLKKVQTIGGVITSVSGVIGIIGALVLGLLWVVKHVH